MHRSATLVQRRSLASLPLTWLPQTKKVGIVGGGPLGEALAFQCALAGFDTSVMDLSMIALERMADAHRALSDQFTTDMSQGTPSVPAWGPLMPKVSWSDQSSWDRLTSKTAARKIADKALSRLTYSTDAAIAMDNVHLVVESLPEDLDLKISVFTKLHQAADASTIFTTAATTLLPSQLAEASGRPLLFCALHFSEDIFTSTVSAVIPHSSTDPLVVAKTRAFADSIHITPLTLGPCFGSAQGGPYAVRKEADA